MAAQSSNESNTPHSFAASANLLRMHYALSSRSVVKMEQHQLHYSFLQHTANGLQLIANLPCWPVFSSPHCAFTCSAPSSVCQRRGYQRQCQKLCWTQHKQHPLPSPPPPSQWSHCRRLTDWSDVTSPSQIHADYSPTASCLLCSEMASSRSMWG